MRMTRTRDVLAAGIVGALLLAGMFVLQNPSRLTGRVLSGDAFLLSQYQSDFDRDGDIDFLDFTVFSSFYEES